MNAQQILAIIIGLYEQKEAKKVSERNLYTNK